MTKEQTPGSEAAPSGGLLDDWMTREQLALELDVSIDTLKRWQAQRIGPPSVKMGRRTLYRRGAVRDWMVDRETRPVAARAGRQ